MGVVTSGAYRGFDYPYLLDASREWLINLPTLFKNRKNDAGSILEEQCPGPPSHVTKVSNQLKSTTNQRRGILTICNGCLKRSHRLTISAVEETIQ